MAQRPERWIIMLERNAAAEQTRAAAEQIDKLGAAQGFKTVDHFPGAILVQGDEAFAKRVQQQVPGVRLIEREKFYKIPDTRPRLRKPPGM